MAAYVAALFGAGLLRPQEVGQETLPLEKPNSMEIFYCPLILLRHIHHLPHITISYNHVLAKHS
jgi:hypothetical protein